MDRPGRAAESEVRMKRSVGCACLVLATLAAATPAHAVSFTLVLDPGASHVAPKDGPPEPLSGTLTLEVPALPLVGSTSFALTDVSVTTGGGRAIALDPALASPGLGVLHADGSFLLPTLFLRVVDGAGAFDLAVTDVVGVLAVVGSAVVGLEASFPLDTDPALPGVGEVVLRAVPEPATGLALGAALAALAARRSAREGGR